MVSVVLVASGLFASVSVGRASEGQRYLDAFTADLYGRAVDLMDDYDVPGVTIALAATAWRGRTRTATPTSRHADR